jgi:O-antigen ligase
VARQTSSPVVQLAGMMVYAGSLAFLGLRLQRYWIAITRSLILFLPVLLAVASTYWSSDPDVTLRRGIALFGTTALGLYLAARFDVREIATLLFGSLSAIVSLSVVAAVLAPGFGVHQASDALTAHHAGLWRGLYWHKNDLGPVAGMLALVIIALWPIIPLRWPMKLGSFIVAAVVVVRSGSAQALGQFVLITSLMLLHLFYGRLAPMTRAAVFVVLVMAALPLAWFYDDIERTLLGLLGRDATLSSRTYIWQAAVLGGLKHPVLGNGYQVGWYGGADVFAMQLYYIEGGHAHNGYLQIWLDLGFVGAAMVACVILILLYRIFMVSRISYQIYLLSVYFMLLYLTTNYVTSMLMTYQNVYWLMFSLLFVLCSRLTQEERARLSLQTSGGRL